MTRVILATCRHLPGLTSSDAVLARALVRHGADVSAVPWDLVDPARPEGLVCLRSTWDYFRRWTESSQWVTTFAAGPGRLLNPAPTVLWNADKTYLRELAAAGIALPRTRWFDPGTRPDIRRFLDEAGLDRAVIKPRISGAAYGTHVVTHASTLTEAEWAPLEQAGSLLQAFVPEIAAGELSLVFLDGRFSHAVRKIAAPGDFRVQSDFGGRVEPVDPSAGTLGFARAVLTATPRPWLYARVDIVETPAGPLLMELEILEPDLFLGSASGGADRLAAALLREADDPPRGLPGR